MSALRLEGASKVYRSSHLGRVSETTGLHGLTFSVEEGEVFGLLGLNGAGKTTAIKLVLGLHLPTKGSVSVLGRTMPDPEALARIGYLPESAYLNGYLTGRETVRLLATLSRVPARGREKAVADVLERVGLAKAADARVSGYSKGMLQRLSIAQALVHDPALLVFDEPITGLDPLAVREFRELVVWLKGRGKTVFFSSHDISEVEKVCDRLAILDGGRLVRTVGQAEWRGREGELERIFASSVKGSDKVGPIRFS